MKRLKERFPGKIVRDDQKNKNVLNQLKKYLKVNSIVLIVSWISEGPRFRKKSGQHWQEFPTAEPDPTVTLRRRWPSQSLSGRRKCKWPEFHSVDHSLPQSDRGAMADWADLATE